MQKAVQGAIKSARFKRLYGLLWLIIRNYQGVVSRLSIPVSRLSPPPLGLHLFRILTTLTGSTFRPASALRKWILRRRVVSCFVSVVYRSQGKRSLHADNQSAH